MKKKVFVLSLFLIGILVLLSLLVSVNAGQPSGHACYNNPGFKVYQKDLPGCTNIDCGKCETATGSPCTGTPAPTYYDCKTSAWDCNLLNVGGIKPEDFECKTSGKYVEVYMGKSSMTTLVPVENIKGYYITYPDACIQGARFFERWDTNFKKCVELVDGKEIYHGFLIGNRCSTDTDIVSVSDTEFGQTAIKYQRCSGWCPPPHVFSCSPPGIPVTETGCQEDGEVCYKGWYDPNVEGVNKCGGRCNSEGECIASCECPQMEGKECWVKGEVCCERPWFDGVTHFVIPEQDCVGDGKKIVDKKICGDINIWQAEGWSQCGACIRTSQPGDNYTGECIKNSPPYLPDSGLISTTRLMPIYGGLPISETHIFDRSIFYQDIDYGLIFLKDPLDKHNPPPEKLRTETPFEKLSCRYIMKKGEKTKEDGSKEEFDMDRIIGFNCNEQLNLDFSYDMLTELPVRVNGIVEIEDDGRITEEGACLGKEGNTPRKDYFHRSIDICPPEAEFTGIMKIKIDLDGLTYPKWYGTFQLFPKDPNMILGFGFKYSPKFYMEGGEDKDIYIEIAVRGDAYNPKENNKGYTPLSKARTELYKGFEDLLGLLESYVGQYPVSNEFFESKVFDTSPGDYRKLKLFGLIPGEMLPKGVWKHSIFNPKHKATVTESIELVIDEAGNVRAVEKIYLEQPIFMLVKNVKTGQVIWPGPGKIRKVLLWSSEDEVVLKGNIVNLPQVQEETGGNFIKNLAARIFFMREIRARLIKQIDQKIKETKPGIVYSDEWDYQVMQNGELISISVSHNYFIKKVNGIEYLYYKLRDSDGNIIGEEPVIIQRGGLSFIQGSKDASKLWQVVFDSTGKILTKSEYPYAIRIRVASVKTETYRTPINQKIESFNVCYAPPSSEIKGTNSIYIIRDIYNPSFEGIGYNLEFDGPVLENITKIFNLDNIAQEQNIEHPKVFVLEDLEGCNIQTLEPQNLVIEPNQAYDIMSTDGNMRVLISERTFSEAVTGILNKVVISDCGGSDFSFDLSGLKPSVEFNLSEMNLGNIDMQQTFEKYSVMDFWKHGILSMEETVYNISKEFNGGTIGEETAADNLAVDTILPSEIKLYELFGVLVTMDLAAPQSRLLLEQTLPDGWMAYTSDENIFVDSEKGKIRIVIENPNLHEEVRYILYPTSALSGINSKWALIDSSGGYGFGESVKSTENINVNPNSLFQLQQILEDIREWSVNSDFLISSFDRDRITDRINNWINSIY